MNKIVKKPMVEVNNIKSLKYLRRLNMRIQHGKEISEDELAHYGVIGMKWGIRRYQNSDGSLTGRGRARLGRQQRKEDYSTQRERSKALQQRRTISDTQLKQTVQRLEAEKKLKQLVKADLKPGETYITDLLSKFGVSAVGAAAGVIGATLAKEYLKARGFPVGS